MRLATSAHHELQTPITPTRRASLLVSAGLFVGLVLVRTHDITQTFRLLGEQVRDWRIALRPFAELPLVGTPSTAGGTTLGPIYYWVLWLSRILIGPFCNHLPHAGGIGIAALQSAADVALFRAMARRFENPFLAAATVVLAATSPYDLTLSAIVWNPPVAVAFVKFTMASFLRCASAQTTWATVTVTTLGWLAVQAHSPALFVVAPMIFWMVVAPLVERGQAIGTLQALRVVIETIAVLQVPWLVDRLTSPSDADPGPFTRAVIHAVHDPASLQFRESWRALVSASDFLMFSPPGTSVAGIALVACMAVVVWRFRQDRPILVLTSSLLVTWAGFALLERPLTERYWYVSLMPVVALVVILAIASTTFRAPRALLVPAILAAVLVWAPFRIVMGWRTAPFPEYGALVAGSREIRGRTAEVRTIAAPFLPPSTDPAFIYEILGGRVSPSARWSAEIARDGTVRFVTAR